MKIYFTDEDPRQYWITFENDRYLVFYYNEFGKFEWYNHPANQRIKEFLIPSSTFNENAKKHFLKVCKELHFNPAEIAQIRVELNK